MNCRNDVVERIHRIFLSAGVGSNKQLEVVRALGRAGGPKTAKLIEQNYQQAFTSRRTVVPPCGWPAWQH